jgi:hypothetical protein
VENSVCATSHLREVFAGLRMAHRRFLDLVDDGMRLFGAAMDHQPARTFRDPHSHHEHDEAKHGTGKIGEPPAEIDADKLRVEQHDGGYSAHGGADPETAVDDEIGPATVARRHQLLNGRVDRGVFAADAGASQEPKQRVGRDIP